MRKDEEFKAAQAWGENWLERLQTGKDEAMWSELFTCFAKKLRRDIRTSLQKRGLDPELAEDVEQDTWAIVAQKIGSFVSSDDDHDLRLSRLYNWMRVIALNRVRMIRRGQKVEPISLDAIEETEADGKISLDGFAFRHELYELGPERKLLIAEKVHMIEDLLQSLSERDREILMRRLINNEKPRTLAAEYGIEPRSISQILFRTKQTLERQRIHFEQ